MTTAILEILFLLSISCLIGIFFTYRYWKSKVDDLQTQIEKAQAEIEDGQKKLAEMESLKIELEKAEELSGKSKKEIGQLQEKSKSLQNDLKSVNSEIDQLQKQLAEAATSIESLKKKAATKKAPPKPKADPQVNILKKELELKEEELGEKEREIEVLSAELHKGKISYYKQIDGKRYKALTLKIADESVAGKGDGRISKEDAEKVFATISDGTAYTQVEKHTLRYIRDNYNWTEGADELFRKKVRSWAAKGHHFD